jgi:phenylalanyl-tRNA synthetase beta chain
MFVSYRWLERHVDLDGLAPEQLADDLTLSTAEVESVEPFLPHLSDVTVGYVQERAKHPDADKLSVCSVDLGNGEPLQIVCGAPNVDGGQKVAVATVGTRLPGDLKIKKARIRGVESRGMICSVRELGLGDEHDGIWVLPEDAAVGQAVSSALGLEDWVIEIDNKSVTHRPDLWGHRGIAREVAAIHRRELKPLDTSLPAPGDGRPFPVRIESAACPRYLALALDGVRGGPSPDWLRHLLLAAGQRPLDLLVDLSNFVMLDLGQPNHLFDRTRLSPEGIVIRKARAKETIVTLDDKERALETSDLLICSGDQPVALAGVMGGEGSKVARETGELLLEVAAFDASSVRRTSARLGLRTDASARFEKSLDPNLPLAAAGHLVRLLQGMQPDVRLAAPLTDVGEWSDPSLTVALRPGRVRTFLGEEVDDESIADILTRLSFGVERGPADAGVFDVHVPSFRASRDVTMEQDLIEEIGRIWRYGNVPEQPIVAAIVPPAHDARRALVRRLEDRLAGGAHFHQTLSYSFVSDDVLAKLGALDTPHVAVINPVAEGVSRLRRSVVPSLLALLEPNRRRRERVKLFEIGKGYVPHSDPSSEPAELHELGLVLARPRSSREPRFDQGALAELRGVVEDLLLHAGPGPAAWVGAEGAPLPAWAHPGRCVRADFGGDAGAAVVAAIEPGLARELGLAGELASDVAVARVSLDALLAEPLHGSCYRPIPRFPGVKLDVALAVPEELPAGDVRAAIERAGKGLVAQTELFDLYTGPGLGAGRKSLAWHVVLQAADRTLGDEDEQRFLKRLERGAAELGGELRSE